jgi:hypothetical protein
LKKKKAAPAQPRKIPDKKAKAAAIEEEPAAVTVDAGQIEIELNLQRGDTAEELERNYQLKLQL